LVEVNGLLGPRWAARMRARATIFDVAERAGVSVASVSRALRGVAGVRPELRERIKRVADELGYVPSGPAASLASRRLGAVGLVFPDLDDPSTEPSTDGGHETLLYADEVIRGAERAARAHGVALLVAATHRRGAAELVRFVTARVDGVVVLSRVLPDAEIRQLAMRTPVVLLAGRSRVAGADVVRVDNEGGVERLVAHLALDHGYEDVRFVAGPRRSPDAQGRLEGFQRAVRELGRPELAEPIARGDFTESSGWSIAAELLGSGALPRALVVGNDQMAVSIVLALREAGVRVPQDVAVTGFDDTQLARLTEPGITTVRQPMRELGRLSVELVLGRIEHGDAPGRVVTLETEVVHRASCGCRWAVSERTRPGDARGPQRQSSRRAQARGSQAANAQRGVR